MAGRDQLGLRHRTIDPLDEWNSEVGARASWGGFESLAIPFDCSAFRTATKWEPGGPTIRFHIGLEDVGDLTDDLERGFAAMHQAVA